ncbi:hypothetical protein ACOME3_001334 [Neoechinorhynchus agilis]
MDRRYGDVSIERRVSCKILKSLSFSKKVINLPMCSVHWDLNCPKELDPIDRRFVCVILASGKVLIYDLLQDDRSSIEPSQTISPDELVVGVPLSAHWYPVDRGIITASFKKGPLVIYDVASSEIADVFNLDIIKGHSHNPGKPTLLSTITSDRSAVLVDILTGLTTHHFSHKNKITDACWLSNDYTLATIVRHEKSTDSDCVTLWDIRSSRLPFASLSLRGRVKNHKNFQLNPMKCARLTSIGTISSFLFVVDRNACIHLFDSFSCSFKRSIDLKPQVDMDENPEIQRPEGIRLFQTINAIMITTKRLAVIVDLFGEPLTRQLGLSSLFSPIRLSVFDPINFRLFLNSNTNAISYSPCSSFKHPLQ